MVVRRSHFDDGYRSLVTLDFHHQRCSDSGRKSSRSKNIGAKGHALTGLTFLIICALVVIALVALALSGLGFLVLRKRTDTRTR